MENGLVVAADGQEMYMQCTDRFKCTGIRCGCGQDAPYAPLSVCGTCKLLPVLYSMLVIRCTLLKMMFSEKAGKLTK